MTDAQRVWTRRPSVIQVGDTARVVLLDLDDPAHPPRILTGPAAAVWHSVDGSREVTETCEYIADQFGLTVDDVAADVRVFLANLSADGLIDASETGSAHHE